MKMVAVNIHLGIVLRGKPYQSYGGINLKNKRVLVACEWSATLREALRKLGYDATSIDLLPSEKPGKHIQGNVENYLSLGWDMLIAFPPCIHLAASGARWFKEKQRDGRQIEAIRFFMALINAPIEKICVENPVGIMSTIYRKPEQIIQPWQFGHGETKRTCLWLKNLPPLQPTKIVDGREPRVHHMGPSKDRSKERGRTYQGIADAMADQWGSLLTRRKSMEGE